MKASPILRLFVPALLLAACGGAAAPSAAPASSAAAAASAAAKPATSAPASAPAKPAASAQSSAAASAKPAASAGASAKPAASAAASGQPAASAPASGAAANLTKMNIAIVGGSPSIANIWVGMDQGIFAKYGISIELPEMTAPVGIAALLSNQTNMLIDAGAPIQGDISGQKLAFLGAVQTTYNQFVISAKPNYKSIPELKGKVIASSTAGAASDNVLVTMLQNGGLQDPKNNAQWIYAGTSTAQATALISGAADAAALTWPYYLDAKSKGFTILGDSKQDKIAGASSTLAVSRDWVAKNPQTVDSFLKGLIEATALTNSDHDKFISAVAGHLRTGDSEQDKASLEDAYQRWGGTFPNPPYITRDQVLEGMANTPNEEVKQHKPEDYILNGPLDAIVASGFTKQFVK